MLDDVSSLMTHSEFSELKMREPSLDLVVTRHNKARLSLSKLTGRVGCLYSILLVYSKEIALKPMRVGAVKPPMTE